MVELPAAGTDTVWVQAAGTVSITLAANVEIGRVLGAQAQSLTGGIDDNTLVGGSGNDTLVGGAGFDFASYFEDGLDTAGAPTLGVVANLGTEHRASGASRKAPRRYA